MTYDIILSVEEIDFLKSKKIVRNNIINYKKDLVDKLDVCCEIYNLSFGELIYIIKVNSNLVCPQSKIL